MPRRLHQSNFDTGAASVAECLNAGDQFLRRERLHDIIVGAHLQTTNAIVLAAPRSEQNHGPRGIGAAQFRQDFQTVAFRQHDIEQDKIHTRRDCFSKTDRSIGSFGHFIPAQTKRIGQSATDGRFVLDHHDSSFRHGTPGMSAVINVLSAVDRR